MGKTRQSADLVSVNNIFVDIVNDNVGVGTTLPRFKLEVGAVGASGTTLYVSGNARYTGAVAASSFVGDGSGLTGAGSTVVDDTSTNQTIYPVLTSQTSGTITSSKVSTSKLSFNPSTGTVSAIGFSGSGENLTSLNASNLSSGTVPAARITSTSALSVGGDLYVTGNISFGGTTTQLNTQQLQIVDADIVLGIGTTFTPTDNTANHGGIAIASNEGTPLVNINIDPAETNPSTYKKFMWFKSNTAGLGTDAWLTNYALGIGLTQFSLGVRLAAGGMRVTDTTVSSPQLNISGVSTFVQTVELDAGLKDFYGNVGAAGSVLVSTGAGVSWTRPFAAGIQGVQGIQGTQGTQGIQGVQGTQGTQGIQGVQGTTGSTGATGSQGTTGTTGSQGISGASVNTFPTDATNKADITTRTDSGFYDHDTATTAEGWPLTSNTWYHLLATTHSNDANYYSMQFAASFYNNTDLFYRSTNGSGTTAWTRIWNAANDGAGSGLDADLLDGLNSATANTASTIVARDASGNFSAGTITAALSGNASTASSTPYWVNGSFGTNEIKGGNADAASFTQYNMVIRSWWGIGFRDYTDSATVKLYIDCRTGNLASSGTITAVDVNSTSDIKLKTNIKTLTNSLEKVLSMRGVEFERIDNPGKYHVGVIAQEVEVVVPELVSEDNDGTKTVAYGNITALLIEAIKEQQEQINSLKQEIADLKK